MNEKCSEDIFYTFKDVVALAELNEKDENVLQYSRDKWTIFWRS